MHPFHFENFMQVKVDTRVVAIATD